MGLNIGIFSTIELAQPVNGQLLHLINYFTSSIIPVTRISFCIFIGQARTHGFHHLRTYKILRCDQFNTPFLSVMLMIDKSKNINIPFHC